MTTSWSGWNGGHDAAAPGGDLPLDWLDRAVGAGLRRAPTLLALAAIGLLPASLAAAAFWWQALGPGSGTPVAFLGVGVVAAAAWLSWCLAQAAMVVVLHAELSPDAPPPTGLREAIRRGGLAVVPAMVALATRAALLLLGALPLGTALPAAVALGGALLPEAVLEGRGPLAARPAAVAQATLQAAAAAVWAVAVLAVAANLWAAILLLRREPPGVEGTLLIGAVAAWLAEPLRLAGTVGAWEADRRRRLGAGLAPPGSAAWS